MDKGLSLSVQQQQMNATLSYMVAINMSSVIAVRG